METKEVHETQQIIKRHVDNSGNHTDRSMSSKKILIAL